MAEVALTPADFPRFFKAVNRQAKEKPGDGPDPFKWQQRLVEHVCTTGEWPSLLDLPTGTGKTAALDIAVFLQALLRREAPRRTVFVVDRRVIVQQAFRRAQQLAHRLANTDDEVVWEVTRRLRALAASPAKGHPDELPLQCAELRGGIARDESWAMRPDVPTILVSTVDQVGSRLLFRGYGVSQGMQPVHAGLLGNDALYLLDEVHLSQPFAETLSALRDRFRPDGRGLPDRWGVVRLSATPGVSDGQPSFQLEAEDSDPEQSPVLHRRLATSKPARLVLAKPRQRTEPAIREAVESKMVAEAQDLLEVPHIRTLAVVVNRVDSALAIHRALDADGVATLLLTGRMRPFDRDDLLRLYEPRLATGRERSSADEPLVVVATQAIEAGADFDFDGMVAECASLDALRQRFGRVDRDGFLDANGTTSQGVIVAAPPQVAFGTEDPVYGAALAETWRWLERQDIDFGHDRMDLPSGGDLERMLAPRSVAPVLLPSHLDAWVQTSPRPDTEPDVSLWLHGVNTAPALDVNIVWREDLTAELLRSSESAAVEVVAACPPASGEAVSVPVRAARAWMRAGSPRDRAASFTDVEGRSANEPPQGDGATPSADSQARPVLVWRPAGEERWTVARDSRGIRPGDTLVAPASYGGLSSYNWDPTGTASVTDLGLRAQLVQRRRAVLRLHPSLVGSLAEVPNADRIEGYYDGDDQQALQDWLAEAASSLHRKPETASDTSGRSRHASFLAAQSDPYLRFVIAYLHDQPIQKLDIDRFPMGLSAPAGNGNSESTSYGQAQMLVVTAREVVLREMVQRVLSAAKVDSLEESDPETVNSEPETSSFTGQPVTLNVHLVDVEGWGRALAAASDLAPGLVNDVALAGRLHDLGKCDLGFQAYLHGGRLKAARSDELLAKGAEAQRSRRADRQTRRDADYPLGTRHELVSLAMLEASEAIRTRAHDWDLVLYLVASHHGYGRPFAPVEPARGHVRAEHDVNGVALSAGTDHGLARLDRGVPQRFWRLVRRYGWHGLAWLESILRLADHRASADDPPRRHPKNVEVVTTVALETGPMARRQTEDVELPALEATNPLGFLAALGAIVELERAGLDPALHWTDSLVPVPVVTGATSIEEIVQVLVKAPAYWLQTAVLLWPPEKPLRDAKPSPDELREWAEAVAAKSGDSNRPEADLWAALVAEGAFDNSGKAKPTHLHFTAGRQQFLVMARELAQGVDVGRLKEALVGPWRYDSPLPSFSWDVRGERIYALRGGNPAKEKRLGVPGVEWLAWLGLSCYPVAARAGRNGAGWLETTACNRSWKRSAFRWPVWTVPLHLSAIRSLLNDPDLIAEPKERPMRGLQPRRLQARGIYQVLESPIRRTDQGGYGSFGAPTVLGQAANAGT